MVGVASASSTGAGVAFACSAGAAISLDLRIPTCLSGATSFAWLYMSEAILPRTISCTNWSSVNAVALSLIVFSIISLMIFSCEVFMRDRVSAERDMRSL